jgi:hypothetical protein
MAIRVDTYKHLDETDPILVDMKGVTILLGMEHLVKALLKSNRGVQRLLSALYHVAEQRYIVEANQQDRFTHYMKAYDNARKALKTAAENWEE